MNKTDKQRGRVMTNGEKIKETFPNIQIFNIIENELKEKFIHIRLGDVCQAVDLEWWKWWNAEYKEPVIRDNEVKDELNRVKDELEPTTKKDCNTCTHSNETDGSNCYECVKGMCNNYEPTTKNDSTVDCISRQALLNATVKKSSIWNHIINSEGDNLEAIVSKLPSVPTQEPKIVPVAEIKYDENKLKELVNKAVLTVAPQEPRWIPVSEKLPNDRDWYLGIFKEPDTGWINPLPFICDYVGHETKATTKEHWILRGFTDIDKPCDYYLNLECVAWMPLPQPYREVEE